MASSTSGAGIRRTGTLALAALLLSAARIDAQTPLTLEQAASRRTGDYAPAWSGLLVTVHGQVSTPAYRFLDYTLLPIQQGTGGIVLHVTEGDTRLDAYQAGDWIEVTGTVSAVSGMPVIDPARIAVTGRDQAPRPERVPLTALLGFQQLGRLVETEGQITEIGETTKGPYVLISAGEAVYKLFIPHSPQQPAAGVAGLSVGDKVRSTGVALQYCPLPPYNRWFEMLLHEPGDIILVERSWFVPPSLIGGVVSALVALVLIVWWRERRLRAQRERLRKIYQLGEEVLGASSADAVVQRIGNILPEILGVSRVRLFLHDRGSKTLDAVVADGAEPISIPLASPPGGTHAGAAACFHYRTLLSIPDISRSPFPIASTEGGGPKSLLFVPMLTQGEVVGVFELDQDDRAREFTPDEQALAQHLGNQIGVALRLLDQRSVQEQLFRTEKMAAVGRLISGVVNELKAPLASIADLADLAQNKPHPCPAEREIAGIAAEAKKASGIVARLVSFAAGQVESSLVDVNVLLRNLIEFRLADWKASGIRVCDLTGEDSICVLGSQGQLEQVFLNLLVHGEQLLADAPERVISVRTSQLAKRALIEIGFSFPGEGSPDEGAAGVLGVARSVIAGHGGTVRLVRKAGAEPHFEIELPLAARESRPPARSATVPGAALAAGRQVTALVIEPDDGFQRQLLTLLAARGYRVVPVNNSDTGLELAQRLHFDTVFCSVHSPGLNWVELSERLHSRIGAFILLSDGYDAELAGDFEGDGRFVLPKPLQEAELERVLAATDRSGLAPARTA